MGYLGRLNPMGERSIGEHDCRFCHLDEVEETIHADSSSVAVPSVGALVDGWTLVFPRQHVSSTAGLSRGEWAAFNLSFASVRTRVSETFGETIWFEHGSAAFRRPAGCGVDHAHIHVVPLVGDVRQLVEAADLEVGPLRWERLEGQAALRPGLDYISLGDATGSWVTYTANQPSQVVRRAIARELAIETWDWKMDRRQTVMDSTLAALK